MPRSSLEKQRKIKVAAAEKRADLIDGGMYRVPHGERNYRWYKVYVQFHPREHWIVEEWDGGPVGSQAIVGSQRKLDDTLKGMLESWLC